MPAGVRSALLVGAACGVGACGFDLFHRTDWRSRCDEDPWQPDCSQYASAGGTGGAGGSSGGAPSGSGASGGVLVTGGAPSSSVSSATGVAAGASGSGGSAVDPVGCADGQREGFADVATYPDVAACAGGWAAPGVQAAPAPTCSHQGGDDGKNPGGTGCSAGDLCAPGWHVCASSDEVALATPLGCSGIDALGAVFFATGQSGPGLGTCGTGANDLFGCGSLGALPTGCTPLDRFSGDLCTSLGAPWSCGAVDVAEAQNVVKTGPDAGGVICCKT